MLTSVVGGYRFLYLQLASLIGYGWAIITLSFVCSFLMQPLMQAISGIVSREKEYEDVIGPQVASIRVRYASDMDRHFHIQALYRRYGYSPLAPIKKVMPLFVQLPFLLLTYYMLRGTVQLSGVSFLFLSNLGEPDKLVVGINLLPLVMTGANVLTVFATSGFSRKDWTQAIGIALLFLILLYSAPSALLLYWTVNNMITLVRTLVANEFRGWHVLCRHMQSLPVRFYALLFPSQEDRTLRFGVRVVRNYFVGNFCLLFPLCAVVLCWLPHQLIFEVRSNEKAFLQIAEKGKVIHNELLEPTDGVYVRKRVYVPTGVDVQNLTFSQSLNSKHVAVRAIEVHKWKLLSEKCEVTNKGELKCLDTTLLQGRGTTIFILELLLFLIAYFFAKYYKYLLRVSDVLTAMTASGLVVMVFCVALPLQTYFVNQSMFSFDFGELMYNLAWRVPLVFLAVAFALLFVRMCYGAVCLSLMLALVLCGFLESGLLSLGLPPLTGNMDFYANRERAFWDAAVWLGIFFVAVLLTRQVLKKFKLFFVLALVVTIVSLIGEIVAKPEDETKFIVQKFLPRSEVGKDLKYSSSGNVILVVLDSICHRVALSALNDAREGRSLMEKFNGFTIFTNHIGMHTLTNPSTAGILTGQYLENPIRENEYYSSIFSKKSVVANWLNAQAGVYLMPGSFSYGIATEDSCAAEKIELKTDNVLTKRINDLQNWNLVESVAFRSIPFGLKGPFYRMLVSGWGNSSSDESESLVFKYMTDASVEILPQKNFIYVHTLGAHPPVKCGRYGQSLSAADDSFEASVEVAIYDFRLLGQLMDELRRKGVYDSSLIIVAADHGRHYGLTSRYDKNILTERAQPFLWIKPAHTTGAMALCSAPTSHSKIYDLLRKSIDANLKISEVVDTLTSSNRLFRVNYAGQRRDWWVDAWRNVRYEEGEFSASRFSLCPIRLDHKYSFLTDDRGERADVEFIGAVTLAYAPEFNDNADEVTLRFRVNDREREYFVTVGCEQQDDGVHVELKPFKADGDTACLVERHGNEMLVGGVRPNAEGILSVSVKRNRRIGKIFITSLKVW